MGHASDCATNNAPALPVGPCNCAASHTPGPWRWELNEKGKSVSLTGGNARNGFGKYDMTVMDFVRYGMSGAAPRFLDNENLLCRADDFGAVVQGREHHASWFKTVEHADARLIAAAPDLLEALQEWVAPFDGWSDAELGRRADPATIDRLKRTRAAIAKATQS